MILLWKRKEIIGKKELNRRIEVIKKVKYLLETDGKIRWGDELITNMNTLYDKSIEAIGEKYTKQIFQ